MAYNNVVHHEIERRFLVTKIRGGVPALLDLASKIVHIEQGYFEVPNPNSSVRVRIINGGKAEITVKTGKGLVRRETPNEQSGVNIFLGMDLLNAMSHQMAKTRYVINGWEIDVFKKPLEPLIFAEIEMKSPDEPIQIPDFIEEYREVTDSLTNLHLARLATELRGLNVPAMPFITESLLYTIPCIGLVGGPGSGKSGIIKILKEEFPEIHFVPEVATIVIGQVGILPSRHPVQNRRFQKAIYGVGKIFRATSIQDAIVQGKKAVVLDRPEADGAGYFDGGIPEFEAVIGTTITAEYRNIDLAICLQVPLREIYEAHKEDNPNRSEPYEEAVAREEKTIAVWKRHPNFHLIGNEGGWEAKVDIVRQLIKSAIKS